MRNEDGEREEGEKEKEVESWFSLLVQPLVFPRKASNIARQFKADTRVEVEFFTHDVVSNSIDNK